MNFIDRYNAAVGAAVAVFTALFGVYWYLFAGYLILNVLDWLTGWYKSRKLGRSQKSGLLDYYSGSLFDADTLCSFGSRYVGN